MDWKKNINELGKNFAYYLLSSGTTYVSIILKKNTNFFLNYSSNENWNEIYTKSGFYKSCHLIEMVDKVLLKKNNFTLYWNLVQPKNDTSIFLNEQRKSNNMFHGVSLCTKNPNGVIQIITLTGRKSEINFEKYVNEKKQHIFNEICLRKQYYKVNI